MFKTTSYLPKMFNLLELAVHEKDVICKSDLGQCTLPKATNVTFISSLMYSLYFFILFTWHYIYKRVYNFPSVRQKLLNLKH